MCCTKSLSTVFYRFIIDVFLPTIIYVLFYNLESMDTMRMLMNANNWQVCICGTWSTVLLYTSLRWTFVDVWSSFRWAHFIALGRRSAIPWVNWTLYSTFLVRARLYSSRSVAVVYEPQLVGLWLTGGPHISHLHTCISSITVFAVFLNFSQISSTVPWHCLFDISKSFWCFKKWVMCCRCLSVGNEVQMICILSGWCYFLPIISWFV